MELRRRQRKLIGAAVMVLFVVVYALLAMAVSQARPLQEASKLVQGIWYAVIGLAWILPMMPLIRWMERGRE
ncbi:MAG: DUF2842 domain-containing protein [Beijerinckiaceae bacterium]